MRPKIEHRLGVKAPAEVVWALLSDLSSWRDWNPMYPEAKGVVGFGELLTLTLALPGRKPRVIRPRILDWGPNDLIHWKASAIAGLVQITHYIEIEKMSETGCIFSNGEIYEGALAKVYRNHMRRVLREAFTRFGEAMRDAAEARWRAEGGDTT